MGKLLLTVAFAAAGLNSIILKLGEVFHIQTPLYYCVALCLPAAVMGSLSWHSVRSFGRSRVVVLCVAIGWLGMLYAAPTESRRGFVAASYLTMILPLAALIVETRSWWHCARVYVMMNVLTLALALCFEYQSQGVALFSSLHRFGFLRSSDGVTWLANPNMVGGQLAFAAVLAFLLYLRDGAQRTTTADGADRPARFSIIWTVVLSLGCVLTASRGAFIAWLGGMGLLFFWGTRSQQGSRLRDLVAVSLVLLLTTFFGAVASGYRPWESLQKRFDAGDEVFSLSGRVLIWQSAIATWQSNTRYFLMGTGTGAAPEALGQYLDVTLDDGITPAPLDAHNAFVEWGLSFGVAGIAAGLCLVAVVWRKARQLDGRDGGISRQAILLCFCLQSMNYVTYYQFFFVPAGAMMLAMLSER